MNVNQIKGLKISGRKKSKKNKQKKTPKNIMETMAVLVAFKG